MLIMDIVFKLCEDAKQNMEIFPSFTSNFVYNPVYKNIFINFSNSHKSQSTVKRDHTFSTMIG